MNSIIFKYPIVHTSSDKFLLELPIGAEFLTVKMQKMPDHRASETAAPQMWFRQPVPRSKALIDCLVCEFREFLLVGTGQPFTHEPHYEYLGTFLAYDDRLVLHLFETTKR